LFKSTPVNPERLQAAAKAAITALKTIGRGHSGSKNLSREQSEELFEAIFGGEVGELELGAILLALRVKGESQSELQGALQALETVNRRGGFLIATDVSKPVVVIPSYNGARLQANLTPLLACVLADAGVQVIVHGVEQDNQRTTSAEIFAHLGLAPVQNVGEVASHLEREVPAFVPIRLACPPLASLLALRSRMGVRNIAHTLAKMFNVTDRADAIRLTAFTHPEFNTLQHDYFVQSGATAFIMRATEGECVANTRRQQPIDVIKSGMMSVAVPGQTTAPADLPALPAAQDAIATARWIQSVLAGELELPASIAQQSRAILEVCYAATA
jgi:anthranilate phosphoribosyltransferase